MVLKTSLNIWTALIFVWILFRKTSTQACLNLKIDTEVSSAALQGHQLRQNMPGEASWEEKKALELLFHLLHM